MTNYVDSALIINEMEQSSLVSEILVPPLGEIVIAPDVIQSSLRSKDVGIVAIGGGDRVQREIQSDKNGLAYVEYE